MWRNSLSKSRWRSVASAGDGPGECDLRKTGNDDFALQEPPGDLSGRERSAASESLGQFLVAVAVIPVVGGCRLRPDIAVEASVAESIETDQRRLHADGRRDQSANFRGSEMSATPVETSQKIFNPLFNHKVEQGKEEFLFGREVEVDGTFGEPGRGGDPLH